MVAHVEALWDQAVLLYKHEHQATAGFLSIVVFEELAKLAFLRIEVAAGVTGWHTIPEIERSEPLGEDVVRVFRRQFSRHREKQASGMAWAFRINSRITRLFGSKEAALGQLATEGEMEALRQSLLYMDLTADGFSVPSERDDEVPLTLVALAGEALAETAALNLRNGIDSSIECGTLSCPKDCRRTEAVNSAEPGTSSVSSSWLGTDASMDVKRRVECVLESLGRGR